MFMAALLLEGSSAVPEPGAADLPFSEYMVPKHCAGNVAARVSLLGHNLPDQ
jgi:hypothetical protein